MSARFRLYRFHHADGSSKDWAIRATEDGVIVRYGKTGHLGRIHEVPRGAKTFRAATPESEAERRIGEQLRQGYEYVSEAVFDSRGVARLESEAEQQHLHWTVELPAGVEVPVWAAALLTRAQEIGRMLCEHGYLLRWTSDHDTVTLHAHDDSILITFGFCDESRSGMISRRTRRGSGSTGAVQRTAEILFLLALAKSFPEFALADDDQNVIEPKLDGTLLLADHAAHHLGVAEDLGLSPPRIHWDAIGAATPTLFY